MGITVSAGEDTLSASDVKTLYESNSDTNVFTDSEKTDLAKNTLGLESFFLEVKGQIGGGPGWADEGFISFFPVLLFSSSSTERSIHMFFALSRIKLDAIDPQVGFIIYSTSAPLVGDAVRWQLTVKYIGDGEDTSAAADETLLQTQVLTTLVADSRQAILFFTLDRTLISNEDAIHLNLERLGGDVLDTYGADIGAGQGGIIAETLSHNP